MYNILFYGNCQAKSLSQMMTIQAAIIICIECFTTQIKKIDFLKLIKRQDFIVMQYVNKNYRNKDYLSSDFIVNNKKESCKIIFVDNCYMTYYHPDMTYLYQYDQNQNTIHSNVPLDVQQIKIPYDYHHKFIVDSYLSKKTVEECIEYVKSISSISFDADLATVLSQNIAELDRRHQEILDAFPKSNKIHLLPVSQYISDNYDKVLLFYTINHPTKHLFQYICGQIKEILQIYGVEKININLDIDPLNYYKGIVFDYIKNTISADMRSYIPTNPMLNNYNKMHKGRRIKAPHNNNLIGQSRSNMSTVSLDIRMDNSKEETNLRNFIQCYYDAYTAIRLETLQLTTKK